MLALHSCALTCAHYPYKSPCACVPACVHRCSTAGRGGCERAPASQSSMTMMARYIIWQSDGAAGSGLGAPVAAVLLALEQQPLARGGGPGAPSSGRARAASGHQLSSSRQSFADSTTPLGMLVADPVGRPQCRVPHAAVPQDTGLTQPLASLNAAPHPPRRHSARFRNPYAHGGAKTSGGLPSGRVAGATPPCRGHAKRETARAMSPLR